MFTLSEIDVFGLAHTSGPLCQPLDLPPHGKLIATMTLYSYSTTVERDGKRYYACSDDFPGVYGLGKSIEEAKKSILQAMRLYIQHCRKKGKPLTPSRSGSPIQ